MGIIDLLKYYNIELSGKNVTIIGRSDLVGKPLASLMINKDATVTLCHSKTKNLRDFTRSADILVVAVGKPNLIKWMRSKGLLCSVKHYIRVLFEHTKKLRIDQKDKRKGVRAPWAYIPL